MRAKTIMFTGVNQVAVGKAEIPEPGPGEVLIWAAYTCISPGTELRCLAGKQQADMPWPFIPGYALAGTVIAAGEGTTLPVGARVFCSGTQRTTDRARLWGGHVEYAVAAESAAYRVPDGLDLREAVLAKLAAITYHGVRLSRPLPHEKVAVVGLGPIGQLAARLHALTGAQVVGADLSAARIDQARRAGLSVRSSADGLAAAFAEDFPDGADVVVDSTGVSAVLAQTFALLRPSAWDRALSERPRLLVQGSYPGDISFDYHSAFRPEVTLYFPRDQQPEDIGHVLGLMARGLLRAGDLITQVFAPEDAPEVYRTLREDKDALMTAAFRWID
jgi:3-hydroxyethyl bacteriochlorophyllide a dehydrogenase